jgi:D-alanyl-D-alanine carboxypeptidase
MEYAERVSLVLASLEIPADLAERRSLALCPEAAVLVVATVGDDGREYLLTPQAARAWHDMCAAALADGVTLKIVSAFRSLERQAEIIRAKRAEGLSLDSILAESAPPGYSEHHSGCAVDITTEGVRPLEVEFERTPAYEWLSRHAGAFDFSLSFPAGNPYGYAYEPWHWCYKARG